MDINVNVTFSADPAMMDLLKTILGTVSIKTVMEHADPKELPADAGALFEKKLAEKARDYVKEYDEKVARKNTQEPEKVVSEKPAAKMKPVSPRKAKENEDIVSLPSRAEQEKAKAEEPKEKSEKELRAQARKSAGEVSRSGKVDAVKARIAKYEAKKLSDIPTDKRADFIKEGGAL